MTTAVLIDGAFFIKRIRHFEPQNAHNAQRMSAIVGQMAHTHLRLKHLPKIGNKHQEDELYRIFFYDCAPLEKKMHRPVSSFSVDFSRSDEAVFRRTLHTELVRKRKLALRLGKLADGLAAWRIKPEIQKRLWRKEMQVSELKDDDIVIDVKQKGVDMRIALDIASITFKKQADRIVLIAGDADFVPAAKLARREGIDFILDPMHQSVPADLFEHIDGLTSAYYKPKLSTK